MMLVAAVQRNFGLILAPLVFIGFLFYLYVNIRKARPELGNEIELAANRKPYFDDEALEGPRLDRYLTMALALLAVVAVGLPLYWLAEPGRQSGAVVAYNRTFVKRGAALFEANCKGCHSAGATGGVASYVLTDKEGKFVANVSWRAPALNNALLRFSREEVNYVLDHGRAFSPMQPWSTVGGGAMNQQQISNIIDYLKSVTLTPDAAQAEVTAGVVARVIAERGNAIERSSPQRDGEKAAAFADRVAKAKADDEKTVRDAFAKAKADGKSEVAALVALGVSPNESAGLVKLGEYLFNNTASAGSYSCARCHTSGWSFDRPGKTGTGAFGPELVGVARKFKDAEDFQSFLAEGCIDGKVYGVVAPDGSQAQCKSGMMPGFGSFFSQDQLKAVVAYVSGLTGNEQFDPTAGKDTNQ